MSEVVLLKSPTCQPCKKFLPVVMSAVTGLELPLRVIDVTKVPDAVERYQVTAVPTLILESDGENPEELYRLVGPTTKVELVDLLRAFS
jgi:thiol-disulfide isomerase/thioredoxin